MRDKIFPRINLLEVSFSGSSEYACVLLECSYKEGSLTVEEATEGVDAGKLMGKAGAYVIVFSGYGIITKARTELPVKLLEKISSGGDEFLWTEDGDGKISLLRREQSAGFEESVTGTKAAVIGTILSEGNDRDSTLRAAGQYLARTLKVRRLFTPDATGSGLCKLVFDKLKLTVLALVLLLLTANHFRGEKLQAEAGNLRMELMAQEHSMGAAGEADRRKNALFEKYDRRIPHGFAWICDRVAIVLPATMSLTSLRLQPLEKKIENGKEVRFTEGRVEIAGYATNTEDIMLYISALKKLEFAREVRMVSFEQDRNSADLLFNLMLTL